MADPTDVAWLIDTLGDKVVFEKEYHLAHESFMMAQDMSYFEDVIDVINKHHSQ
jgi:hypothetical protein